MYLAIEIGGAKLQLAVGPGDGSGPVALERFAVDPSKGAEGILAQIEITGGLLVQRHEVSAIGVGFGGPVEGRAGRVVKSHHVSGWDGFELADWCQGAFGLPAVVANDCDVAGLAEARFGAGQGMSPVLYVTVGTGIGAGLVIEGQVYRGHGQAVAELGHLRPGLNFQRPDEILESIASGWGIAAAAASRVSDPVTHRLSQWLAEQRPRDPEVIRQWLIDNQEAAEEHAADLRERCHGELEHLTARHVAQAAAEGNELASEIFSRATTALGWAVAQAITLLSPQIVVIGGGVSLAGDQLFFEPMRKAIERYAFPPLEGSYEIAAAKLGEEVVLYGALAMASETVS